MQPEDAIRKMLHDAGELAECEAKPDVPTDDEFCDDYDYDFDDDVEFDDDDDGFDEPDHYDVAMTTMRDDDWYNDGNCDYDHEATHEEFDPYDLSDSRLRLLDLYPAELRKFASALGCEGPYRTIPENVRNILYRWCMLKADSLEHATAGHVDVAERLMRFCDRLYDSLPDRYRW